jgi:peroxiredoxin
MTKIGWRAADALSRALSADERDAVCGDLAEQGASGTQALGEVLGLVARRQAAMWRNWRPWLALIAVAIPLSLILTVHARLSADNNSIYLWMYTNNWDWPLLRMAGFRRQLAIYMGNVLLSWLTLACWSWTSGVALGRVSRRAIPCIGSIFCLMLVAELGVLRQFARGRTFHANAAVFAGAFYRLAFPAMVQVCLVILPAIAGMRRGVRWKTLRPPARAFLYGSIIASVLGMVAAIWPGWLFRFDWRFPLQLMLLLSYWPVAYLFAIAARRLLPTSAMRTAIHTALLLAALAGMAAAADPAGTRAPLQPAGDRQPAPEIKLKDGAGRTVTLKKYRGKVVLLDFWATWCHGCKEEIPWFAEFQRRYSGQGLRVVGVSLDDDGWKAIKPFLQTADVPYRIVLGDQPAAKRYGIESMPDTFLIDRQGRLAAAYTGLVDKDDVEANLRTLLSR